MNLIYNNKLFILLNPLLIYIVITIIYLLLFIYFADISLCDSDSTSLEELKANLMSETDKYYKALNKYKDVDDLLYEAKNHPEKHEDIIKYLTDQTNDKYYVTKYYLAKVSITIESIRKIEPNYVFSIKKYYIARIHV